ncbi:SDR family NAD(P)-dependent oxidoreductase [Parasulfitobacter algicola]|uniref:SDR family oxidoreductase n=1 Tax=Parasulfitobacter algicola TaxID=2614809 RepID=A0ABX2IZN6_9RHOB|nr:SDR family oxidoreductase [Sulfitobacter algicola]NSX56158.1 SDR family oxidoreductase [Sulfitobacter algicola]
MTPLDLFSLKGRVAVVTGASSGIGQHLARALSKADAKVVAIARRAEPLQALSDECAAAPLSVDLANISDWDNLAEQIAAPFGPPQIILNAAGVNLREPAGDITKDSWDLTLHLNLSVPFFLARALLSGMNGWGRIINFASLQSQRAFPNSMAYGASKGGVAQLTRAMAEAWSHQGITTNAIAPGFFPTELTGPVFADTEKAARNASQTAIGRNGRLDDLTGPAIFLCSNASAYVTGQVLYIDGGFTAK